MKCWWFLEQTDLEMSINSSISEFFCLNLKVKQSWFLFHYYVLDATNICCYSPQNLCLFSTLSISLSTCSLYIILMWLSWNVSQNKCNLNIPKKIDLFTKSYTYNSSPVLLSSSSSNEVNKSDESCNFWPVLTTLERRVTILKTSSSGIPFSSSIKSHNRLQT